MTTPLTAYAYGSAPPETQLTDGTTPHAPSEADRDCANQIRYWWGNGAPGWLEDTIAAHTRAAVERETAGLRAIQSDLDRQIKEYRADVARVTAERDALAKDKARLIDNLAVTVRERKADRE